MALRRTAWRVTQRGQIGDGEGGSQEKFYSYIPDILCDRESEGEASLAGTKQGRGSVRVVQIGISFYTDKQHPQLRFVPVRPFVAIVHAILLGCLFLDSLYMAWPRRIRMGSPATHAACNGGTVHPFAGDPLHEGSFSPKAIYASHASQRQIVAEPFYDTYECAKSHCAYASGPLPARGFSPSLDPD